MKKSDIAANSFPLSCTARIEKKFIRHLALERSWSGEKLQRRKNRKQFGSRKSRFMNKVVKNWRFSFPPFFFATLKWRKHNKESCSKERRKKSTWHEFPLPSRELPFNRRVKYVLKFSLSLAGAKPVVIAWRGRARARTKKIQNIFPFCQQFGDR